MENTQYRRKGLRLALLVVGYTTSNSNRAVETRGQVPRKTEQKPSVDTCHLGCDGPQWLVNGTRFKFPYRESSAREDLGSSQLPSHRAGMF